MSNSTSVPVRRSLSGLTSVVKNAEGEDSPASTRRDMTGMFGGWLAAAGAEAPAAGDDGNVPVEVDPVFASDAEEFQSRMPADPEVSGAGHLYK